MKSDRRNSDSISSYTTESEKSGLFGLFGKKTKKNKSGFSKNHFMRKKEQSERATKYRKKTKEEKIIRLLSKFRYYIPENYNFELEKYVKYHYFVDTESVFPGMHSEFAHNFKELALSRQILKYFSKKSGTEMVILQNLEQKLEECTSMIQVLINMNGETFIEYPDFALIDFIGLSTNEFQKYKDYPYPDELLGGMLERLNEKFIGIEELKQYYLDEKNILLDRGFSGNGLRKELLLSATKNINRLKNENYMYYIYDDKKDIKEKDLEKVNAKLMKLSFKELDHDSLNVLPEELKSTIAKFNSLQLRFKTKEEFELNPFSKYAVTSATSK